MVYISKFDTVTDTWIDLLLSSSKILTQFFFFFFIPHIFWFFFVHTPDYLLLYFFQTTVITTLHQGRYHSSFTYSTPLAHWFLCTLNSCAACHWTVLWLFTECTACIPSKLLDFPCLSIHISDFCVKFLSLDTLNLGVLFFFLFFFPLLFSTLSYLKPFEKFFVCSVLVN